MHGGRHGLAVHDTQHDRPDRHDGTRRRRRSRLDGHHDKSQASDDFSGESNPGPGWYLDGMPFVAGFCNPGHGGWWAERPANR
ncbi:MAG TPA: hypothetical protein VK917_08670 [Ilumatobacter sp.]|nr:hypothetical protein [Ilumatobacter sp.]